MVTSASLLLRLAGQHVNAAGTTGQPGKTGTHPHDDSAESPSGCDTNSQGPNMTQWHETEPRPLESDELQNARALIEKLQGLNASLQHQVTALHTEIARADEHANELRAQLAQQADPEPDLDTVELKDLLDAVRCFLGDGQAIVIRAESDRVTIQALNEAQFVCSTADARDVLDHATALGLHLVMF